MLPHIPEIFLPFLVWPVSTYSLQVLEVIVAPDHTRWHTHTTERPFAATSTWQHTTFISDRHPRSRWNSNPQSQQASGRRPLDRATTIGHISEVNIIYCDLYEILRCLIFALGLVKRMTINLEKFIQMSHFSAGSSSYNQCHYSPTNHLLAEAVFCTLLIPIINMTE